MVSRAVRERTCSARQSGTSGTSTAAPEAAMARAKRSSDSCFRPGTVTPCSTIHPGARRLPRGA